MDAEKLNQELYDKMTAEQKEYRSWLLGQTPEEVLNHAYEYAMREDILMEMEALGLPAPQAAALLESPSPLADVYKDFRGMETDHMDTVRECIEERAGALLEAQRKATRSIPLYQQSGEYAREHGELETFRASWKANTACRDAIDAAIRDGNDGMYLHADVKGVPSMRSSRWPRMSVTPIRSVWDGMMGWGLSLISSVGWSTVQTAGGL